MSNKYVKIHDNDNVAIVVNDSPAGTEFDYGLVAINDIPQAHKIALCDIEKGAPVIRYDTEIGYAKEKILKGSWINEYMLDLPAPPSLDNMEFGTNIVPFDSLPKPIASTWLGYTCKDGRFASKNILGVLSMVQCGAGVVTNAVKKIKQELLPKYPNVDDVVAINHAFGCGVAILSPEAEIPVRTIRNMVAHPNFDGEVIGVALGCEKLTFDMVFPKEYISDANCITLQECHGYEEMISKIMAIADRKLQILNQRTRKEAPLSELVVGLQCGGSDAFSGVTANPSVGYAADMLVKAGATVMFSENTEVRDGAHLLAARCVSQEVCDRLAKELKWSDDYLANGSVDRNANPSPGNKRGGLANVVEKSMGSIAKSGTSPIVEVIGPGERPSKKGLIYAAAQANDFMLGTGHFASGMHVQVFTSGRGTSYGLSLAPIIKMGTRNDLKNMWFDLIDVNAGPVATGEATIQDIGTELFQLIVDVASGRKKTFSDQHEIFNDICVFNPAPNT